MAKSFFEVFPQLKLDTDLHGMLDDATVSKVSTTRQRNSLRIYLGCGRLLPKEKIYFLESELKRQLFPHHTMNIKIIEHFQLSEQYTLKNLLDVYWSSILTEFHRYSLLEYNLLRQAKVDVVEENTLRISLEDSVLAHQKEEEIYHILEKIFSCGIGIYENHFLIQLSGQFPIFFIIISQNDQSFYIPSGSNIHHVLDILPSDQHDIVSFHFSFHLNGSYQFSYKGVLQGVHSMSLGKTKYHAYDPGTMSGQHNGTHMRNIILFFQDCRYFINGFLGNSFRIAIYYI